jgi:hypothetical protein
MNERSILPIINPAEEAPNKQQIRLRGMQSVGKSLRRLWTQRTKIDPLTYSVLCHSPTHIPVYDSRP